MHRIFYFLFSLALFSSCLDEQDCLVEASDKVVVDFRNRTNGNRLSVIINNMEIQGSDSIFYPNATRNNVIIPLDIYNDKTSIIINSNRGVDTLVFEYSSFTRLISPDCGTETYILDFNVTEHTVDSLRAVNTQILPDVPVNYEIYY